ncbi:unnamed protein product [Caenorhabditis sp. 36 PRJEB53466]|nr:unnamed protein product [Caenorhabditis sp. 36 PRJEB53466]
MKSFYDIIEIPVNAAFEDVKKAYFRFLRQEHPDKNPEKRDTNTELLNTVGQIWEQFKDNRPIYDSWLREQKLRETQGTIGETVELEYGENEIDEVCRCGAEFSLTPEEVDQIIDSVVRHTRMSSLDDTSTKILVLGDSCVGKTSLCHCVAGEPARTFDSTIGATVIMAWHEYRAGTPEQRAELIELWDVGGMVAHRQAAHVFFEGAVGAILVHDLTNKRSEENLATWLTMLDGKPRAQNSSKDSAAVALKVDIESCNIPVLIVGTKADLVPHKGPISYDRLHIDSLRMIQRGSANSITLGRFFDSCLDRTRRTSLAASTSFYARSSTTPNTSIIQGNSGSNATSSSGVTTVNRTMSPFTTIPMGS